MSDVGGNCFYLAFLSKNTILLQYIYKLLFYENAFINYAKFICMKSFGKISCFSTEDKTVFSFFKKTLFYIFALSKGTQI